MSGSGIGFAPPLPLFLPGGDFEGWIIPSAAGEEEHLAKKRGVSGFTGMKISFYAHGFPNN